MVPKVKGSNPLGHPTKAGSPLSGLPFFYHLFLSKSMRRYARVIVPLPLNEIFTYAIPEGMDVSACRRVIVPFGARHFYTGIVESVSTVAPPPGVALKEISSVLDDEPMLRPLQIRFWQWLADYYLCTIGEVYNAALPSGLKIGSETRIALNPDTDVAEFGNCTVKELAVLDFVKKEGQSTAAAIRSKTGVGDGVISKLVDRGLLIISEKLVERYRSEKREYVRPAIARGDRDALDEAFARVKKSPRQEEALMALVALSGFYKDCAEPLVEVPMDVLLERAAVQRTAVKALADKEICEIYKKEVSRFSFSGTGSFTVPSLSKAQDTALKQIHKSFVEKDIVLLRGVTGSGKTEIYIHLIDYVLRQGRQALFLVPEIALTTQLTRRLQRVFGSKVVIYHSKFSDNERVDIWKKLMHSAEPCVVIGARSAVFLPFSRLGIVIVDEEHESSYKQADPAPRYNGRDAAAVLASMHGAKTLFGSATPAVETYFKACTGKFGLVELSERFGGSTLPDIDVIDMKAERGRKAVSGYFSHRLLDATLDAMSNKRQAILFHNRRGYAPMARCTMCAFTPKCNFCDVSLTFHRRINKLVCHYCGTEYNVPTLCPECREPAMEITGYGTERLEEEIEANFRDRKVLRMDLDTTRNKDSYGRIIDDFSAHKADILIGTQMVTKGLDFGDVGLVGVLNADTLLNFPDFRSAERAFNMLEQIAGRAGRRDERGHVFVQTYTPEHPVLGFVKAHDYIGFYERELDDRRAFAFPPFTRIINIYIKHRDEHIVCECASQFSASLREVFGPRVSPPKEPAVSRVSSMYIRTIMLKVEREVSMNKVKEILRGKYVALMASPLMRGVTVYYDVDPV